MPSTSSPSSDHQCDVLAYFCINGPDPELSQHTTTRSGKVSKPPTDSVMSSVSQSDYDNLRKMHVVLYGHMVQLNSHNLDNKVKELIHLAKPDDDALVTVITSGICQGFQHLEPFMMGIVDNAA